MNISTRIGYWVVIAVLLIWAIYLEVQNRELCYNDVHIRGSISHRKQELYECHQHIAVLSHKKTLSQGIENE